MEDVLGVSILHDPGAQTSFDLVAVHGIKGHPYHTWAHPNGEKWLEEYLPKDLPDTRILTFGYNAQVFTSSKGYVTDFAEQLLQHLTSVRRSTDTIERPISFVCHSLGGLIVKKALLLAQAAHDAAAIRKATVAVVFMGTPHRGSQLASYADIAVTCVKAVGFKANTASLHQLKLDSDDLEELGSQFGSLLQSERIKVLTFYELKPTRIAGIAESVVVPKWSAKLGLGPPLETIIPVDADHRQIAQFPSRDSKQYSLVRSNLAFILSSHTQVPRTDDHSSKDVEWNEVLLWLDALRNQSGSTLQNERAHGTCKWIYEKQPFQKWRCSEGSAGLWIFGKPGVGKTVLSNYIAEALKSEDGHMAVTLRCHSYRSLNDPIHALVRDILFQALQIPALSARVKRRLLDLKSQTSAMSDIAFDTLLEVVDDMLSGTSNLYLIVDGIDELDQQALELESFLHKVGTLSQSAGLCKVLIVSRNTPPLEKLLAGWNTIAISSSDSLYDISVFLSQKLESMGHLGRRRDEVIERLVDGSKGLFLWADLAVSELDHLRTWNEVEALLENGNRGLDVTYATIIKQLDNSSEGLCRIRARALPLVAIACRPFRLEEITELLAVEVSKGFVDPGNKLLGGWSTLSRACGPFLQTNELGTIELIHVSAKDFLMSHPWAKALARENLIDGSADTEMACLCLSYLNFTVFGRIPGEDVKVLDVDSLSQQYPLLEYASHFWSNHFLKSEKITTLQLALLEQFLNSPCSVTWTTTLYPHFSLKYGETHGTILRSQQSIIANLKQKLRISGGVDPMLSKRCIERCSRLLLESTQDSLRMEQFHSGPAAKATLEKKLRLAQCYCALYELDAAEEISSEACESAQEVLGDMQPLTLQLQHVKLYTQMRIHQRSSTVESCDIIPDFITLVQDHIEVFGPDHVETLDCRHDLALMHFIRRDFTEARKLLEPLHRKMVETMGRTSRVTQSVASNLASCADMQKQYDYAESILHTIPELSKAAAEPLEIDITSVHAYTLHALSILAAVLAARGEDRKSAILHQRVIDTSMILEGPKAQRVYESAINKGQAMRDQFKYREARKHYLNWLKKSDKNFGPESKHSREMRKRLADLDHREKKWKEMERSMKPPMLQGLYVAKKPPVPIFLAIAALLSVAFSLWTYLQ